MPSSSPLRFLITAGPTREFLDPVRFLSNRSSGKMGYALAEAARAVSPHVVLVSGPTALTPPAGVEFVPVTSAAEMADAVFARFDGCDVAILAAAVCDFRPKQLLSHKIKKAGFGGTLELEPTVDILAELGRRKRGQVLVGFALETEQLETNARAKLERKRLDWIVANGPGAFDGDSNTVALLDRAGHCERLAEMPKRQAAAAIIARVTPAAT